MGKAHPAELKKCMDKKLLLKLNVADYVQGILWGSDPFMNFVIGECVEMATGGQQNNTGLVAIRGDIILSQSWNQYWLCSSEIQWCPHAPLPCILL